METIYRKVAVTNLIENECQKFRDMLGEDCGNYTYEHLEVARVVVNNFESLIEQIEKLPSEIPDPTAPLQKDKEELLEMLEMIVDGTAFCNKSGRIWQHWLETIESLIQKHKQ